MLSKPKIDEVFDGIVHDGKIILGVFETQRFICPRCKGKDTFICPDAIIKKRFLSCYNKECLKENSKASKTLLAFWIMENSLK